MKKTTTIKQDNTEKKQVKIVAGVTSWKAATPEAKEFRKIMAKWIVGKHAEKITNKINRTILSSIKKELSEKIQQIDNMILSGGGIDTIKIREYCNDLVNIEKRLQIAQVDKEQAKIDRDILFDEVKTVLTSDLCKAYKNMTTPSTALRSAFAELLNNNGFKPCASTIDYLIMNSGVKNTTISLNKKNANNQKNVSLTELVSDTVFIENIAAAICQDMQKQGLFSDQKHQYQLYSERQKKYEERQAARLAKLGESNNDKTMKELPKPSEKIQKIIDKVENAIMMQEKKWSGNKQTA